MKYEKFKYDRIFEILRIKIESGLMPKGTALPPFPIYARSTKYPTKRYAAWWPCYLTLDLSRQKERQLSVVVYDHEQTALGSDFVHSLQEPNIPVMTDILKNSGNCLLSFHLSWDFSVQQVRLGYPRTNRSATES